MMNYPKYESYKDSGIDWLGEIPSDWVIERLGSNFSERRTKVSDIDFAALSVTKNGIVPQLESAAKTKDGDNRKLVRKGDFVINSRSDRKGSSGVSPLDGSVSLINIILKPLEKLQPEYCHHLLRSYAFIEEYYRVGRGIVADLWTTRYDEMRTIRLAIPPIQEQNLIAKFLDQKTSQIDEAIRIKEKQIELLKEQKQIMIQNAVTKGLDPNVKMKDSGVDWIGEIPEHWEVKKLKFCLEISKLKEISKTSNQLYLGMESIESKTGLLSGVNSEAEGLANVFRIGQILFGKLRPYLSKVYLADFNGICSTEFLVFDVKKSLNNSYAALLLRSTGFINVVNASTYGSKMPRANSDFIMNLEIVYPPISEQSEILLNIEHKEKIINSLIDSFIGQIEKLKEYKTTLINSAVTGKIKVTPEMVGDA